MADGAGTGHPGGVAIIGLAGRLPGAPDIDAFWENLKNGVESVRFFSESELMAAGADPAALSHPLYVRAKAALDDADRFDAGFFGYSPREAAFIDPQQRLFLETAHAALETAGYDPGRYPGWIGVYGSTAATFYWHAFLRSPSGPHPRSGLPGHGIDDLAFMGNEKDFLATRVAYKLDLKGPALDIQTACSTSLVAVHVACQALLGHECDMALAGGVTVSVPPVSGYLRQEAGVLSSDGHCRPFDARADGIVPGDGVAIVVLKRLADALADGDTIHAVIEGSAINNDGAGKASFAAPTPDGQAQVILLAQQIAGVGGDAIGYVETHGTGTPLGDPIEIAGLTRAFRHTTARTGFCAVGSLKSNMGHLGAAAGVTGLIKAALCVRDGTLVPSLHFESPNPAIDFAASPFQVNTALRDWPDGPGPRRAGVSAFGIGGTNAHVIVAEPPPPRLPPLPARTDPDLIVLSARDPAALDRLTDALADHLRRHPGLDIGDVAHTLHRGRRRFAHRRALVCRDAADAAAALAARDPARLREGVAPGADPGVAFLFPGGGTQYPGMGRTLYRHEPEFRGAIDRCAAILAPLLPAGTSGPGDMRRYLHPTTDDGTADAAAGLGRVVFGLPAVFSVDYALAQLWLARGVRPSILLGHSLGEYVAACLAGVFSLEDALRIVVERARLLETTTAGAMLSVPLAPDRLAGLLADHGLDLAAVNGPALCTVSGAEPGIDRLVRRLGAEGIECRRLPIAVGGHSRMVEPILDRFRAFLATIPMAPPRLPVVSNLSGGLVGAGTIDTPDYWCRHLRETVRFTDGLATVLAEPGRVLLEVGPGFGLGSLARQHSRYRPGQVVVGSLAPTPTEDDRVLLLDATARLWLAGVAVDGSGPASAKGRRRVPLPTYPFERRRHWIEPEPPAPPAPAPSGRWLVLGDDPQGEAAAAALRAAGIPVEPMPADTARDIRGRLADLGPWPAMLLHAGSDGVDALVAVAVDGAGGDGATGTAPDRAPTTPDASTGQRPTLTTPYAAPTDDTEGAIAVLWAELLGFDRVGRHDNFFELGGHSLRALQVIARINDRHGVKLPLRAFFEAPTVAGLADRVAQAMIAQVDEAVLRDLLDDLERDGTGDRERGGEALPAHG